MPLLMHWRTCDGFPRPCPGRSKHHRSMHQSRFALLVSRPSRQEEIFRFCLSIRRRAALWAAAVFTGQDGPFLLLNSVFGVDLRLWDGVCSAKPPTRMQTMLFTISTRSESRQSATIRMQGAFEFVSASECNWKACYDTNGALRMVVCGTRGSIQS